MYPEHPSDSFRFVFLFNSIPQEALMPMNESIAAKIRAEVNNYPGVVEKRMFGGIGFMVNGNMACGVNGSDLIVRVGPDKSPTALARPHTKVFDMTGRPMLGWIRVEPNGFAAENDLKDWIKQGMEFALTLPPK
jgi:TfoX/Sxy family transcriptional regulator of competence genes